MTGLRLPRVPGATQQQQSAARGVVGIAGLGWASILIAGAGFAVPSFCSGSTVWQLPGSDAFSFAFLFRSPGQLALAWGLMLAAMMVPMLVAPLSHVRSRVLPRHRGLAMAAFLAGYAGLWMLAGAVLVSFALTIRLGFGAQLHGALALCAMAGALVWQASPVKQYALNQCHRLPAVAGFAPQAYGGAFAYGLRHGG
jgi:hypothetical protein